jgi:hypothetical protein
MDLNYCNFSKRCVFILGAGIAQSVERLVYGLGLGHEVNKSPPSSVLRLPGVVLN